MALNHKRLMEITGIPECFSAPNVTMIPINYVQIEAITILTLVASFSGNE